MAVDCLRRGKASLKKDRPFDFLQLFDTETQENAGPILAVLRADDDTDEEYEEMMEAMQQLILAGLHSLQRASEMVDAMGINTEEGTVH